MRKRYIGFLIGISTLVVLMNSNCARAEEIRMDISEAEWEVLNGYIPEEIPGINLYDENYDSALYTNRIPSSYDARENFYTTAVKDQNVWGNCWAFSTIGVAESSLITQERVIRGEQATKDNIDLSERFLTYFMYNSVEDPLGNTKGDYTRVGNNGSNYLDVGGNMQYATFACANWIGAADEALAPWTELLLASESEKAGFDLSSKNLNDMLAYQDIAHMQNAYWVSLQNHDEVKKMILEYGGAAISYYHANGANYYNTLTAAYYNGGIQGANHAAVLVGWDDNYSRTNFSTDPGADGAWLVKNSWGSFWGDEGFFWISYEDIALNTDHATAYVFDFESSDNYMHNYQYDGSQGAHYGKIESGGSIANVFTASGNESGKEILRAVSFALYDVNVDYSIQIYTNVTGDSDPTDGTPGLSTPEMGKTAYAGYYTIPLSEEVLLEEGEKFSVIITLSKSNGENIGYFVDQSYSNGGYIDFGSSTSSGQSFGYISGNWYDLDGQGVTARIKAFTDDISKIFVTDITLSQKSITLDVGASHQLSAQVLPLDAGDRGVIWKSSDESIVSVDENGLVTAHAAGKAEVMAQAVDGSGAAAVCRVTVTEKGAILEGWNKNAQGQWSFYENGSKKRDCWITGKDGDSELRYVDKNGYMVTNEFKCDGVYTYYLMLNGAPMKNRLSWDTEGTGLIYFDEDGHMLFDTFKYCIDVGYTCYFNSLGRAMFDQIVFYNGKPYYLNATGRMEDNGWFRFSNNMDYGFANADGKLCCEGFGYDPWGRVVFYHWNGMVARGLISDGIWYYHMNETDGHYMGKFR